MSSALILGLFFQALFLLPQAQKSLAPSDLYKTASPSVVLIETYRDDGKILASGSGFVIGADGVIITNFHVIEHTKRATVRLSNDDAYDSVSILDVDRRKDIAVIKIKAVNLQALKLGHSAAAQVGDHVYALGNPLGVFQNTLSDGIISGIRQADGYRLFQLTAPISHGSSGGPVFGTNGEVIGIIELTVEEGQNLNFAIPIDYALGMLDSRAPQPLASIYGPEPTPKNEQVMAATPAAATPQPPTSPPLQTERIKHDSFTYVGEKMQIWTKQDAELELGQPFDRRDAVFNNRIIGDIYKYVCPEPGFGSVELNFNRDSKKLVAAYFYYQRPVAWTTIKAKLGKNYKKTKMENGRPGYLYQFQQRQVFVLVDSADNVVSLGIW